LRIGLVVESDDLELLAVDAALGVYLVGEKLENLQTDFADRRTATRQWIDVGDLYVLRLRAKGHEAEGKRCDDALHEFPPS
jgi:hypothetical protein